MITALLLFLPTTIIQSIFIYIVVAFFRVWKMKISDFQTPIFRIIVIIVVLSILNFVFNLLFGKIDSESSGSVLGLFPYSIFMIFTYIIAKTIDRRILIFLLYFICLEIFVGVLEYAQGTVSFFSVTDNDFGIGAGGEGMLYNMRVCGLSLNSSALALKSLLGLVIVYLTNPRHKNLLIITMIIGLFITFNRTYIISSAPLLLFFYWNIIKQYSYKYVFTFISVLLVLFFLYINIDVITQQFFRGATAESIEVISSGRDKVYPEFWSFFERNIFMGNGSVKLWLELVPGRIYHAHNSFLMTLASNGIIIFFFYLNIAFGYINKRNFIPVMCIIISSIFQYTIFWGISLMDIIFLLLLLHENTDKLCQNSLTQRRFAFLS